MKTFLSIIFCSAILLTSCGNNQSKSEAEESSSNSTESSEIEEAKNCDEFIDQYEKWMDDYIVIIDKFMKNPTDADLMSEYMKVAEEGMNWMNQWNSKLAFCASKEKYEKRFNEISEKAEKKLEEMGIE